MAQFCWTDDLYTRNTLIDGDHRKLIGLVNAWFETMQSGPGSERLSKAMDDLIACTEEHFRREEAEMERIQYVAVLAHRAEHTRLLRQLVELKAMLDAGGRINVPAVSDFLSEWLREHILAADMKLAGALRPRNPAPSLQLR
jgi:hemerythrin